METLSTQSEDCVHFVHSGFFFNKDYVKLFQDLIGYIVCGLHNQLDAKFRIYETSFQHKGEGSDFPAKAFCNIIEVCLF